MSAKHIHIYHLGTDVSTQRTPDAWLMSHLVLNYGFSTSEIWAINHCRMSKEIFFMRDIFNHQGIHLHKSAADTDTTFNLIHDFNWPRRHHTTIAAWSTWKKSIRTSCIESKVNLRAPLGKWTPNDNKYITFWKWFLSHDLHTLYYREHGKCWKYEWPLNRERRRIESQTDTKSGYQCPYCS